LPARRRQSLTYPGSASGSPFVIGYDYQTTGEMTHIRDRVDAIRQRLGYLKSGC